MNTNNDCNMAPCYGVQRTPFDRMMQKKYSPLCAPSAMVMCDQSGNPMLSQQGKMVELFKARSRAMRAARARARARKMRPTREYFKNGKNGKKKAVLLTAPWCGWCKKLKGELGELKQLLDKMNVQLDHIEDEKEVKAHMAKDNRAKGFPSCLLMNEDGEIVDVLSGFRPAKEFAKAVKEKYKM